MRPFETTSVINAPVSYQLKGGEEWRDGVLYGWTGRSCTTCNGGGEDAETHACRGCAGTGETWGVMPVQPER